MSRISYDPVKDRFATFVRRSRLMRRGFYFLLDLLFLRSWHVRKTVRHIIAGDVARSTWKILDAGCGFGQYERFLLSEFRSARVLAVDLKESYLEDCKHYFDREIREGRIRFEKADLLAFETDEKYDLILCIDVLEHIEQDEQVLLRLSRSLKPGGRLLMHSPSHHSREDAGGTEESFVDEHARTGYSKEEISRKFLRADLTPEKLEYTYGSAGHLSWVISVKYPMLLLNRIGMYGIPLLLIWYPLVLPFVLPLNAIDLAGSNVKGTGILALGKVSRDAVPE